MVLLRASDTVERECELEINPLACHQPLQLTEEFSDVATMRTAAAS